jgi:farnesyl-diphosphate farnesyltransferase
VLGKVSRSFAAVIRQLPPQLLVEVMVFYLVLRALDTVEDDMTAFGNNEVSGCRAADESEERRFDDDT